ncbi:Uncharacterised protein [Mycobacteroides abscessus subsp. abscessus]|nr:Uncharacterised protein [Mycobacteroides abscessus subsp. abscessus]
MPADPRAATLRPRTWTRSPYGATHTPCRSSALAQVQTPPALTAETTVGSAYEVAYQPRRSRRRSPESTIRRTCAWLKSRRVSSAQEKTPRHWSLCSNPVTDHSISRGSLRTSGDVGEVGDAVDTRRAVHCSVT